MAVTVAVGTSNPIKYRAVLRAFSRYYDVRVVMVSVDSGVGPQPSGVADVVGGALARAVRAVEKADSYFGVGVEAGPIEFPASGGYVETQVAAIVDRDCRATIGMSPSFEVDRRVLALMLDGVEMEKAVGVERHGGLGESVGFVGVATSGAVTRQDLTEHAVIMALIPRLMGYGSIATVEEIAAQAGASVECRSTRAI
ncbi:conserved hypothetical protein [Aeropyrum pernix K1]|uniref:Probable inosine/xanthosine triphosphatase n=1 Tax=Aeropyrum pernix (strain ATCC 700893 / DSM 11879 / JCM 9820 / NBRC 100138 / K1) TaxID=272557 RepID=NCPP_AERPE|nr:DUF84 family protein [Aeropyrum pernix]Q9YDY1.2 RecName: Full=Probable inosine/xanthosine triphosphatase; Short=ITPase/XTPase; AltName: Full=Non-canonical purine NTP phosphatase; AltName: Full=Non-standard purine NTP phosphatase; AltName: Full=Nucleoside-triphosphate phosphatase; Short=NTPase [Aeropyrum pernix K1]BAA79766.2 conserved hypothetical protein [Aeropyrum pernix K1]